MTEDRHESFLLLENISKEFPGAIAVSVPVLIDEMRSAKVTALYPFMEHLTIKRFVELADKYNASIAFFLTTKGILVDFSIDAVR